MEKELRTIDIKSNDKTIIKAGELVDVIEVTPLTLNARKTYNLLIDNAGKNIIEPIEHSIEKSELQFSRRGDERVDDSIERLMGAIAKIKTERNGEPAILRVQLLGRNVEHVRNDGKFYYTFDRELREALADSTVFARLTKDVMLNFKGKYGLALYELGAKRYNLQKNSEEFSVDEFRGLLGVAKDKYKTWDNLNRRVIRPAEDEVNQLSIKFKVKVSPIKRGNKVERVKLQWWRTSPDGEEAAIKELSNTSLGRKARRENSVEKMSPANVDSIEIGRLLSVEAQESATEILLKGNRNYSLWSAIDEWEFRFADKQPPNNPDAAFIAFCRVLASEPSHSNSSDDFQKLEDKLLIDDS